ncbi:MAG TPA: alpha/beta fold hydrolase [Thermoanaerobaculia bacterium]|nr:alpha/beta fold hydrolase [Thermoanaerobaculia bacterium]
MTRPLLWISTGLALGAAGFVATCVFVGGKLAEPIPRTIGPPPSDLPAKTVHIPSPSGSKLVGWWIEGAPGRGAVILMHGVRADRTSMVDRARFFHRAGRSVLLFDFQAHGESPGEHITFGALESRDARAAVDFVRHHHPSERIAALGTSLGGAAILLADPPLPVNAVILESVYPTVEEATDNRIRMRLGPLASLLTPALLVQLGPRLGISPRDLRPIDEIGRIEAPVFVLSGAEDRHTTQAETKRLFAAAQEPKELWIVPGAAHVDLYRVARQAYEKRMVEFLER